jgi:hypothetical protein
MQKRIKNNEKWTDPDFHYDVRDKNIKSRITVMDRIEKYMRIGEVFPNSTFSSNPIKPT